MQIIWHGQSCFEIIAAQGKGEHTNILIDPLDEAKTGIKTPKIDAQAILITNNFYTIENPQKISEKAFVVDGPGEYETKGIYIEGIASVTGKENEEKGLANTIYTFEIEDMKLCHLGNLQEAELTDDQIKKIGNIDILMFSVGNAKNIGAKEALKVVSQIEPSIAIPMNFAIPKLKLDADDVANFLKAAGVANIEPLPKLTIKKKEIAPEEAKIIVLTP